MDSDIREAFEGRNGCSRISGRVNWSASTVVERILCSFCLCARQLLQALSIWSWYRSDVLFPSSGPCERHFASAFFGAEVYIFQYNIFSLIFSWFALANIWLTFSIIINLVVTQDIILFGTVTVVSSGFYFCLAMLPLTTLFADSLGQPRLRMDLSCFSRFTVHSRLGESTQG